MNEKIKDLMIESGMIAESNLKNVVWTTNMSVTTAEKFAELIVRECIRIQHERFCEHGGDVSYDIILEHFGFKTYWDRQLELFNERKD